MCVYDATGSGGSPGALLASVPSSAISAAGDFIARCPAPSRPTGKVYLASEFTWTTTAPTMYLVGSIAPEMTLMPQSSVYGLTSGANGNAGYSLTNTYANGCPGHLRLDHEGDPPAPSPSSQPKPSKEIYESPRRQEPVQRP